MSYIYIYIYIYIYDISLLRVKPNISCGLLVSFHSVYKVKCSHETQVIVFPVRNSFSHSDVFADPIVHSDKSSYLFLHSGIQ